MVDRRTILLAVGSFVVFLYLTTYAHEAGHVVVCQTSGYNGEIIIQPFTFETRASTCDGMPQNVYLYRGLGGLFGLSVAAIPFMVFRKNPYVSIGAIPQIIANGITGTLETFANDWYNSGELPFLVASAPMLAAFSGLFVYYFVKPKNRAL